MHFFSHRKIIWMNTRNFQQVCNCVSFKKIYGCSAANCPNSHEPHMVTVDYGSFPLEYL